MKSSVFSVLYLIFGISNGIPRSISKGGGRTPQHSRKGVEGRIVGGQSADIIDYPYMLALLDLTVGGFICGASVIHEHWSLSAAHCLEYNVPADKIQLRGGSTNRSSGGIIFFVDFYTLHPEYNPFLLENDIAMIKTTDDSIMYGYYVEPIPISPRCDYDCCQTCEPEEITITGWGSIGFGPFPEDLREITLPIYNHTECDRVWRGIKDVAFCVWAGEGQDSCYGDSGSPLVMTIGCDIFQVGIVSFGSTNCGDGLFPSVNTRIEQPGIRSWIEQVSGL